MSIGRSLPLGLALVGLAGVHTNAQKPPALPDLLKISGDYVVQYAHQLGAVVADEEFTQTEISSGRMGTPKRVNSQVVFLGQDDGSVDSFRDVVAIDTVPVRPKDDRLPKLFKSTSAEGVGGAQAMTDDAVKAYISPSLHILDRPLLALDMLRAENQGNYNYKIDGNKTVDGVQTVVVKFTEKGKGHVLNNASAVGHYWIDPTGGAIRQTELGFSVPSANLLSTVKFTKDAQLGVLVPSELSETVEQSSHGTGMGDDIGGAGTGGQMGAHEKYEGRATYAKYRRAGS